MDILTHTPSRAAQQHVHNGPFMGKVLPDKDTGTMRHPVEWHGLCSDVWKYKEDGIPVPHKLTNR